MTAILEPQTSPRPAPPAEPAPLSPAPAAPAAAPPAAAPPAAPAPVPSPAAEPRRRRVRPALPVTGVRVIGAVLLGLFSLAVALEPAPNGPQPAVTAWMAVLATVQTVAMIASLVGFAVGRRWALWAGLAFSATAAVSVALCPAVGHHVVGGWWFAQVAIGAAMLLLPAAALAFTRAGGR